MSNFEKVKLGDVCEVVSGTTPSTRNAELWNGDVKWITPAEIHDDSYYIYDTERYVSKKAGLRMLPKGTVLLSSRAPIGKVAIAGDEMCCNQGFKNLICTNRIHNRYLYHFLKGKSQYLNSLGRGATFKEVSKSIVENIEVPLPILALQCRIADVLDEVSNLITQHYAQVEKLNLLVKSRFVEMFGDPLAKSIQWRTMSLKSACRTIFGGGTPSKSCPEYYSGEIPWVTPKDMKSLRINDSQDHITEDAILNSTTKLVPAESVLMVIRSGILKHTLPVAINTKPVTMNQDMKAFFPKDTVHAEYLLYFFKAIETDVLSAVRSFTADNIDFKVFQNRSVPVPPIGLQRSFAEFSRQTDKSKFVIQRSLEELETLKKALMQQYFG